VSRRAQRKSLSREWAEACNDARYLALELAAGRPYWRIDVMAYGFVLEPGETAFRLLPIGITQFDPSRGAWPDCIAATALITNRRTLVRLPHGAVVSLWWEDVVGIDLNWSSGRVALDFGDGLPRLLSGLFVADFAVASTALVYGLNALTTHPALEPLRARQLIT
jgi:hypothetical protein